MKIFLGKSLLALATATLASLAWAQTPAERGEEDRRVAEGESNSQEEQKIKECMEQLKEKNKGIPEYTARKSCRDHVRKQGG